jgi:hypothetical protein
LGLLIRRRKATRHIPLVFLAGDPDKVADVKTLLPDAVFSSWDRIGHALAGAISHAPAHPVIPESDFQAYASKPLATKLGIKDESRVALLNAPEGFRETLGPLPDSVRFCTKVPLVPDLAIWFVRSSNELSVGIDDIARRMIGGSLWIAWPKKASVVQTDLSQQAVRAIASAAGLVDYKICSISEIWSGLLFTRREARS